MDIKEINYEWGEEDPIFSSEPYLRLHSNEYGWFGGFEHGKLRLVIAYVIKKKYIFRYAQIQTEIINVAGDVSEALEKSFLNGVVANFKRMGVDFCVQPPTYTVFRTCPDNAISARFGSYYVSLEKSEEDLWSGIHQKHRNVIRNAQKRNVEIRFGRADDTVTAYQLLLQTMRRSNMPFMDRGMFDRMISSLDKNVLVAVAYLNDLPQGCAVIPFSKYGAYYLYGGSIDVPVLGAMNLLHWEVIKYFKERGVVLYDFVGARISPEPGSKLEGIQRFKSRFGASMRTGYLWKMPISYKYPLFSLMLKLKSSGHGDIIDQERRGKENNSPDF